MSNANREVAAKWFEEVWNAGDEAAIDRLMSPSAKFHGLPTPDGKPIVGPAAFKPFFHAFRQGFPDIKIHLLTSVSEGDLIASHCHVTGKHTGEGLGVKATGASIDVYGMSIARVKDGQIQEGWNCYDFMSLYQKIGMLPPLPGT